MAYIKITENKKGELVARIQVCGKDLETGESKLYFKRIYNVEHLTPAKFRKYVEKETQAYEHQLNEAYEEKTVVVRNKILTFAELMAEWKSTIKANYSVSYYMRVDETEKRFNRFLQVQGLSDKPISEIRVRDVQLFLNSFTTYAYNPTKTTVRLKKDFPKSIKLRELERIGIINRCTLYNLRKNETNIIIATAEKICDYCKLDFDEYFERKEERKSYSQETIKGYRRVLRTLFNEALRYDWITKNPVCGTKIGAGSSNTTLRPIHEKEVYTFKEAQDFLQAVDSLSEDQINKKIMLKLMLLTGIRNAELHGLKWEDVNFEKKQIYIHRNRLYSEEFGVYEKEPKTKTSVRYIPIPDSLVADLRKYYKWFKLADRNFDRKLDQYYLAVNVYREPENPGSIGSWIKSFEKRHGLKLVSCHGLRHTYCSLLLSQNVPIQTVSKYMGHSDSTITLKVYSHFIPDTQEKVINVLNLMTDID